MRSLPRARRSVFPLRSRQPLLRRRVLDRGTQGLCARCGAQVPDGQWRPGHACRSFASVALTAQSEGRRRLRGRAHRDASWFAGRASRIAERGDSFPQHYRNSDGSGSSSATPSTGLPSMRLPDFAVCPPTLCSQTLPNKPPAVDWVSWPPAVTRSTALSPHAIISVTSRDPRPRALVGHLLSLATGGFSEA